MILMRVSPKIEAQPSSIKRLWFTPSLFSPVVPNVKLRTTGPTRDAPQVCSQSRVTLLNVWDSSGSAVLFGSVCPTDNTRQVYFGWELRRAGLSITPVWDICRNCVVIFIRSWKVFKTENVANVPELEAVCLCKESLSREGNVSRKSETG